MEVGYVDEAERFFCSGCWASEVSSARGAAMVLDDEEETPEAPSNFWIVDDCAVCQRHIQYKSTRLLT